MQGMTLVELMVSMVLGLIVIGGAVSLTLANRQSYRSNEGLSQVEEGARTAFELMARDIRQAGASGCDNDGRIANVLNGVEWYAAWFGIRGFDDSEPTSTSSTNYGTTRAARVEGTDAIQLQGTVGNGLSVSSHNAITGVIQMSSATTGIVDTGDIVIACNFDHAAIFQVTLAATPDLTHETGIGSRNCSRGLGFPTDCSTATGNSYELTRNTQLWRLFAVDWYIGQTGRTGNDTGTALFRRRLGPAGVDTAEEIVAGISDMQISYRLGTSNEFVDAAGTMTLADWAQVNAVRIELTSESADTNIAVAGSGDDRRLQRRYVQTITLRNRVP
jgi:type IV pilus assembly protein PilW